MNGLLIKSPWIEMILDGRKTWEIRGSGTSKRGTIALIKSGSGTVVGFADLEDVKGPFTRPEFDRYVHKHRVKPQALPGRKLPYPKTYAWVLKNARPAKEPIPYNHPMGAVIWVKLAGIRPSRT